MAELTISQLIKIIIGIFVVVGFGWLNLLIVFLC